AEHALRDEGALDLLRTAVDGCGPAEQELGSQPVQLVVQVEVHTECVADRVPDRELRVDEEQLVYRHLRTERFLLRQSPDRLARMETQCTGGGVRVTQRLDRGRIRPARLECSLETIVEA